MTQITENPKPESKPGEKPEEIAFKTQYKKRFEDAVADAQYLLMYASSTCPNDIDRGTLERLIAARRRVENNEIFSPQQEADFWLAYQNIWKLVQPVTAEGIKANLQNENAFANKLIEYSPGLSRWFGKKTSSRAGSIVNRYIVFTGIVLLLLLTLQIYWVIGNQLTTQLAQLLEREAEINLALTENQQAYSALEIVYKQNEINSENFKSSEEYNFYKSPEWESATLENISTKDKLEDELVLLKSQLERNSSILLIWSGPWDNLINGNAPNPEGVDVRGSKDESTIFSPTNLSASDNYEIQMDSVRTQILRLSELMNDKDPEGNEEAERLNSTLTPLIDGIDVQLADLYANNNELYIYEAEIQRQIEDINTQIAAVSNGDLTTVSNSLTEQLDAFIKQKATIEDQIEIIRAQPSTDPETGASLESAFDAQLAGLMAEKELVENEISKLENQLNAISGNTSTLDDLESILNQVSASKEFNTTQIQKLETDRQNLISQLVPAGEIVIRREQQYQNLYDEYNTLIRLQEANAKRESSRQAQLAGEFVLVILQSYLLPLLYGILGASTSVLRTLSKQVENVLYSEGARIQHLLRISLGALAGIVVGWFSFLIDSSTFFGSVSPLAIAFLVGYNIEVFFSLMDNALNKIRESSQQSTTELVITQQPPAPEMTSESSSEIKSEETPAAQPAG